jgi:hypothetical protein
MRRRLLLEAGAAALPGSVTVLASANPTATADIFPGAGTKIL